MCKIGERVNVCFDGVLEMEEIYKLQDDTRMCRVTLKMEDGRFCIALVGKEFVSSTLTKEEK